MVTYENIIIKANSINSDPKDVAKALEEKISKLEKANRVKLISACFLGYNEISENDDDLFVFDLCDTQKNICYNFMLFFESISREQLC